MSGKTYKVKDVARLAHVTVRTLHYYHSIGLLVPSGRTAAGYRLYDDEDLLRLQQILLGRELGLPLEQIRRLLDDPGHDRRRALRDHRERLVHRVRRTEAMIRSVDAALAALEEGDEMKANELFNGFDPAEHEAEVKRRWGQTEAYREAARRTRGYSPEDWERIKADHDATMRQLADKLAAGTKADDPEVLALAERHRQHIDRWYYPCSHDMHAALAEMYVTDERFTSSLDGFGAGVARFLAEAIRINAERRD